MNPQNKTPISCEQALEMMEVYIDGELSSQEIQIFELHTQVCVHCSQELHFAQRLYTDLRSFPREYCPDKVVDYVFEHIQSSTPGSRWERLKAQIFSLPSLIGRPAFAGLALAATVAGIMFLIRRQDAPVELAPADVAKAKAQVQWTIAYLSAVTSQAGLAASEKVLKEGVAEPVGRVIGETASQKE